MKKFYMLILVILCIASLSGCGNDNNPKEGESRFTANINKAWIDYEVDKKQDETGNTKEAIEATREQMKVFYGENKEITGNYDSNLAASTPYGTYVGKLDNNKILSWKGIPYAKAPTGNLRWKTPQELDTSNKVYEAYYFGHTSIQVETWDEPESTYPQGEDCLNVSIWNNTQNESTNKAVMVWIHGGGYVQGGSSNPGYNGTNFVTNNPDIIFASIDYRTDFLGFVNFSDVPGGEEYKKSANLGLLDQVAALKWLRENISSFGGDPNRITIFGESAGGGSVSALTIMPCAKGLFNRAIIQSGSSSNFLRTAEVSKSQTQLILDITGAKTMSDLLELTASDIRKIETIFTVSGADNSTYPQLDGITLPFDLEAKLNDSTRDGIDILMGTTSDEFEYWSYILTPEVNAQRMPDIIAQYENKLNDDELVRWNEFRNKLNGTEYKKNVETINYLLFHSPCRYEASTHAKNGNKVYQYLFSEPFNGKYIDPYSKQEVPYGAFHASENSFLFGYLSNENNFCCTHDEAIRLSQTTQKMWSNFAKNGDPSIADGDVPGVATISWDAYTNENSAIMNINSEKCEQSVDPFKENIDLMGDLYWAKLR